MTDRDENRQNSEAIEAGPSAWSLLAVQAPEPMFTEEEVLTLSPSSIQTFMTCPRRFYYQSVLYLKSETSEGASMGLLIHSLMEVFNRQFGQHPYTPERLRALAEKLFTFETERSSLLEEDQFRPEDLKRLSRLDPLSLHELKLRVMTAIEDLARKGYFAEPVQSIRFEVPFRGSFEAIERCQYSCRADALIERTDGSWEIIDYKFYGPTRFAIRPSGSGLSDRLLSALEPLPSGDLSHSERFKTTDSKPRDPQLPLYYLASQQDEAYRGKVKEAALQIIRPPFPDNPEQGAIRIPLPSEALEAGLPQWQADLKQYIAEPVLNGTALSPNPGRHCLQCSFLAICDSASEEDESGPEAGTEGGAHD